MIAQALPGQIGPLSKDMQRPQHLHKSLESHQDGEGAARTEFEEDGKDSAPMRQDESINAGNFHFGVH